MKIALLKLRAALRRCGLLLAFGSGIAVAPASAADAPVAGHVEANQVFNPGKLAGSTETKAERDARMTWWREARFGMFIHWGLYAVPAGTYHGKNVGWIGEWIMNNAEIPLAEYTGYAKEFNPTNFNADEWVKTAKDAGMKYIVITAKHHDGFAMFHSRVSAYNIYDATPFHHDPLAELAAACRRQGMKLGFYYSQSQDWGHPGGAIYRKPAWDPAQKGDYDEYLRTVAAPQVHELLGNYGEFPDVLWWDTPDKMTAARIALFENELKLKPKIITNDRLGTGTGDYGTPEQTIPANGIPGRDWETCMTINDTWGYKSNDTNFKSTAALLHDLIDIASKGGNFLLNVGPDATGMVPAPEVERLKEMGAWLKVNGAAIFGSSASPFPKQLKWGRCTQKDGKLYLHVFDWPADGKLLVPLLNAKAEAWLLTAPGEKLKFDATDSGLVLDLPPNAPDKIASVIVLEPTGELQFAPPPMPQLAADGIIRLTAEDAGIVGETAALEGGDVKNIGYWTNPKDYLKWELNITRPGTFDVAVTYSVESDRSGSEYAVVAGDQSVSGVAEGTGGWGGYRTVKLGQLEIAKSGVTTFTVKPVKMKGGSVMNFRNLTLTPLVQSKKMSGNFVHPGVWHTEAELERVRENVAAGKQPWLEAWNALKSADANTNYQPRVAKDVTDAYSIQNDGHAAYVLAIKWVASGDITYARASERIIDAWTSTVESAAPTTMRNGIGANQMANAAEILAYGFNGAAGWPTQNVIRAKTWFKQVVYPRIKNGASANWGTSCMAGIMSMSVFCDDREMFAAAVDVYKYGFVVNGSLKDGCCGVTQYIDATGENAESGRDQPHSQGGIAHLLETALVAWNQGVNLVSYNDDSGVRDYGVSGSNRLFTGFEYTAKYNLGNDVPYHPFYEYCNDVTKYPGGVSASGRGRFSPVWEMAVHLFTVAGLNPVYCRQVVETAGYKPEKTNSDHPGLGTLMFRTDFTR